MKQFQEMNKRKKLNQRCIRIKIKIKIFKNKSQQNENKILDFCKKVIDI